MYVPQILHSIAWEVGQLDLIIVITHDLLHFLTPVTAMILGPDIVVGYVFVLIRIIHSISFISFSEFNNNKNLLFFFLGYIVKRIFVIKLILILNLLAIKL